MDRVRLFKDIPQTSECVVVTFREFERVVVGGCLSLGDLKDFDSSTLKAFGNRNPSRIVLHSLQLVVLEISALKINVQTARIILNIRRRVIRWDRVLSKHI